MKKGLNLNELHKLGANSIVECIENDCDFYKIEREDDESIRLSDIVVHSGENSMIIFFEIWNGKGWKNVDAVETFYKTDNEELFLYVIEEVKTIKELEYFVTFED